MAATYSAVMLTRPGGPEVLQCIELPIEQPGSGQIRVRVRAAGVGSTDLISRFLQTKGAALGLYAAMNALIAAVKSSVLVKLAPRKVLRLRMPNQISTWLSQLAEVGVK